jgi:hypothetical protein
MGDTVSSPRLFGKYCFYKHLPEYFNGIVVEELTAFVLSIPAILTPLD